MGEWEERIRLHEEAEVEEKSVMNQTVERILAGFDQHEEGRIHVYCPTCGRRQSNIPKLPQDPERAVLAKFTCDKHEENSAEISYWDKDGHKIEGGY